ncbi:MAG: diacylglycerol kinase family protein [Chloroflexota bacterium]
MTAILLVGNRLAGTGHQSGLLERLSTELGAQLQVVDNHPAARRATWEWLAGHASQPTAVIAGGGGGTLRAVVEGACDGRALPPGRDVVRIGGLRMGSGNVVAKRFGVPRDPLAGARHLRERLEAGTTRPCGVIRCRFGGEPRHGVTMCGLGHFGRTSGDLVRLHRSAGGLRRLAARLVPLERLNDAEYLSSFLTRMAASAVVPTSCELVRVDGRRFRLLSGVVMNFPIAGIPIDPGTDIGRPSLGVRLFPRYGRPISTLLQPGEALTVELLDRERTERFLDEDPETANGQITIEAAGTVEFIA